MFAKSADLLSDCCKTKFLSSSPKMLPEYDEAVLLLTRRKHLESHINNNHFITMYEKTIL